MKKHRWFPLFHHLVESTTGQPLCPGLSKAASRFLRRLPHFFGWLFDLAQSFTSCRSLIQNLSSSSQLCHQPCHSLLCCSWLPDFHCHHNFLQRLFTIPSTVRSLRVVVGGIITIIVLALCRRAMLPVSFVWSDWQNIPLGKWTWPSWLVFWMVHSPSVLQMLLRNVRGGSTSS